MCMIDTEREGRLGNLQRNAAVVPKESSSSAMAHGDRVARVDAAAAAAPFGGDDFEPNHVYIPPTNNNRTIGASNQQQQQQQQQPYQQPAQQQQHQVSLSETTSYQPPRVPMASTAGQAQYANGVPSSISFPTASGMPPLQQANAPALLPSAQLAPVRLHPTATTVSVAPTARPVTHVHMLDRRQQFLVFVKILLKQLATTNNEALVKTVKRLLQDCVGKNRQGDPHYQPLHLAAESRILPVVGAVHWNRSLHYLNLFLKKQAQAKTRQAASASASFGSSGPAPRSVAI